MCDDCGCRDHWPIDELSDEHVLLLALARDVRALADEGRVDEAHAAFDRFAAMLAAHCAKEDAGLLAVLAEEHELDYDVRVLHVEHDEVRRRLAELPERWLPTALSLVDGLPKHLAHEEHHLFPATRLALSTAGWDRIEAVHRRMGPLAVDA